MEKEEESSGSGSNSSGGDVWAKLVSLDSSHSDIELRSTEAKICLETRRSPSEKQEWCKITREIDQISASLQSKSRNAVLVDGMAVRENDATIIRCGSEIILGPTSDGFRRYKFKVTPTEEICKKPLKIIIDPEDAKCSICLSVWHDVVTVSPCLHNFCNGCFSKWSERCHEKGYSVVCPQCRSAVQFVGRNHFLHSIEEDILKSDSSLRRSDEEIAALDSYSSIKLPLVSDQQYVARMEQRVTNLEMTLRTFASLANIFMSSLDPLGPPPPLPNTDEPMDTDNEDEHTEDDDDDDEEEEEEEEEEDMYDEEDDHTDDEEEHMDDEEEHVDDEE